MATSEKISISHKQFSQIVKEADPEADRQKQTGYVFSNGRRFEDGDGPYADGA